MDDGTLFRLNPPPAGGEVVKFPESLITDKRLNADEFCAPIFLEMYGGDVKKAAQRASVSVKRFQKRLEKVWSLGYKREDFFTTTDGEALQ